MKRLFLSVAVLAAFASCSKNEVTDVASSQSGSEISFSTLNDRVTKSANDADDNYSVYSVRSTDASGFYIDETLSDLDVIISGSKYYWPVDGSTLAFYACAPATTTSIDLSGASATSAVATISGKYTAPGDEDFTIATPIASGKVTSNSVDLKFAHMLSKVNVTVVLSEALQTAGYEIVDADYMAAGNTVYNYDVTASTDTPLTAGTGYSAYTVNFGVKASQGLADIVAGTLVTYDGTIYENGTDASVGSDEIVDAIDAIYSGTTSYMIMPQEAETCTIQIDDLYLVATNKIAEIQDPNQDEGTMMENPLYNLNILQNTNNTLAEYVITGIDVTENSFKQGVQYNITIVVDGTANDDDDEPLIDPIAFTAEIADWTDEAGTGSSENITIYLYNEKSYDVVLLSSEKLVQDYEVLTVDEYKTGFEIYKVDAADGSTGDAVVNTSVTNDIYTLIATAAGLTVNEDEDTSYVGADVVTSTSYTSENSTGDVVTITQTVDKLYYNYYNTDGGTDELYVIYNYSVAEVVEDVD